MKNTKAVVDWHVAIPKETAERFNQKCKDYGVSKSQVVRLLAREWADGEIKNKHNSSI